MVEHQIRKTFNKGQSRVVSVEVVRKRLFRKSDANDKIADKATPSAVPAGSDAPKKIISPEGKEGKPQDGSKERRDYELAMVLQRSITRKSMEYQSAVDAETKSEKNFASIVQTDELRDSGMTLEMLQEQFTIPDTSEEQSTSLTRKKKKLHRREQDEDDDIDSLDEPKLGDRKSEKHKLSSKIRPKYNKLDVQDLSNDDDLLDLFDEEQVLEAVVTTKKAPTPKLRTREARVRTEQPSRIITIGTNMRVRDLIQKLHGGKEVLLQKISSTLGRNLSMNDNLDMDTSILLLSDLGYKYNVGKESRAYLEYLNMHDNPERAKTKVPVVTVVGHVDHGKTTLLDALRSTSYAAQEHGGITQTIGADLVNINNKMVTFIDTPGHELFAVMRKRGVQVTDVAVLVVAADDSVKPQTVEAIKHIQEAGVPVVVAINKCDLPRANPAKVIQDLLQYGLVAESLGGDVLTVEVIASQGKGLDKLMDAILLQAEVQDLKYDPERPAEVYILDCWVKKGVGNIMNGIVTAGVLRLNDVFVVHDVFGKATKLYNSHGFSVDYVAAGFPVLIAGCKERVTMGSKLIVVPNEYMAKRICGIRMYESQVEQGKTEESTSVDMLQALLSAKKNKYLFLLKAKSLLMLNTLSEVLESFNNDRHEIKIVAQSIGNVSLSDMQTAIASNAHIIKFDVDIDATARSLASKNSVVIHDHCIIYHLLRDIEDLIKKADEQDMIHARPRAQVLKVFKIQNRKIAGCLLEQGNITKDQEVQVIRRGKVITTDRISSLHRYEESVESVNEKEEFGIQLQNFDDFAIDDYISFN